MNLEWTQPALKNLEQIHEYVAQNSARQANMLIGQLVESSQRLKSFPSSGRTIPEYESHEDLREIISGSYRIQYRVDGSAVYVLAVVHCAQVLPQKPPVIE